MKTPIEITAKQMFDKMLEENDECTSTEMMEAFASYRVEQVLKQANQPKPSPENQLYTVGSKIPIKDNIHLKILAYSENYYMARIKGRIPFCCTENELTKKLEEWRR